MRLLLQIMSDLHLGRLDVGGFPPLAPGVSLVIIAGDTCEGLVRAIRSMRAAYPDTEIVTVAGNHEFYGRTYFDELAEGRECARELRVHLLEDSLVTFGKLRILGASLWTDYALFGESTREMAMRTARDTMRDHRRIKWQSDPWLRFRPAEARALHVRSRAFIETELARPFSGTSMILTHHAPVPEALSPSYRDQMLSAAYASDLRQTIDRYQPHYWIWGHTHFPVDMLRGRTRLISNPRAYADEYIAFDPAFTIEVDA